jgi:hypothetical protein
MKGMLSALAGLVMGLGLSGGQAATLLPDGTFATAGDLTRVDTGSAILEFLDWSVTDGQSVATALANYSGAGFRWSTERRWRHCSAHSGWPMPFRPRRGGSLI